MVEASFSYQAEQIKLALEELGTSAEAVFLMIEAWHDEELDDRKISAGTPFFNADDALNISGMTWTAPVKITIIFAGTSFKNGSRQQTR